VQEALTNARKHAPSAPVTVRLRQDRGQLRVTTSNPVPPGITRWDVPVEGNGLIGLEERVRIEGGWFRAGIEDGEFRVVAELPAGAQ
jgi:signal transduction histidine kinase